MSVTHRMESQRGRIGKEIKSGLGKNNKPWANFSLAVDVDRVNDEGSWERVRTDWYQVSAFGALAKNVETSLRPGLPVVVSGEVEQNVRVVEGPDGALVAQTRNEVRASMIAPDLILTSVVVPEGPGREGPSAAGPGTGPQSRAETPAAGEARSGSRETIPQDAGGSSEIGRTSQGSGDSWAFGSDAGRMPPSQAAGVVWPPTVEPGSGSAGLR
ncbi:hypothetical protein GCM10028787_31190 [Brachybacterium horti]